MYHIQHLLSLQNPEHVECLSAVLQLWPWLRLHPCAQFRSNESIVWLMSCSWVDSGCFSHGTWVCSPQRCGSLGRWERRNQTWVWEHLHLLPSKPRMWLDSESTRVLKVNQTFQSKYFYFLRMSSVLHTPQITFLCFLVCLIVSTVKTKQHQNLNESKDPISLWFRHSKGVNTRHRESLITFSLQLKSLWNGSRFTRTHECSLHSHLPKERQGEKKHTIQTE